MLEGQRYNLLCRRVKSLPPTFRNGQTDRQTDGHTTKILYIDIYAVMTSYMCLALYCEYRAEIHVVLFG